MIRWLRWFFNGSRPDWLPSTSYVKRVNRDGTYCILEGATLPHGKRWWVCVAIDPSGTNGEIEVRCGPLSNRGQEPAMHSMKLPGSEIRRMYELIQHAANKRGSIKQPLVKDGFPASVQLSVFGGIVKFHCNLAISGNEPDVRVDLARAMLSLGEESIETVRR